MGNVNNPICLGQENIRILDDGNAYETMAQVQLRLLPKPKLVIECEVPATLSYEGLSTTITVCSSKAELEVLAIGFRAKLLERRTTLTYTPKCVPCSVVRCDGQQLKSVSFDVLNFPKCSFADSFELVADGWRFEIREVHDSKGVFEALKKQGGYGVTHQGTLKYSDSKPFPIAGAEMAMNSLRRFLSFARGLYCTPINLVGYNSDNEVVWKEWGASQVEPWGSNLSWFDPNYVQTLAEVFPGFWQCLNEDRHASAIKTALDWYLRSNKNDGNSAGGLIMSQVALERLADSHRFDKTYVRKEMKKKGKKFSGSIAEPMRLFLQSSGIPSELPEELNVLNEVLRAVKEKADENGKLDIVSDGLEAMVAVRNDLVHPKSHLQRISLLKDYEAWNLAQWYVELVLLRMSGFNGKYANRLVAGRLVGTTEAVPWADRPLVDSDHSDAKL